MDQTGFHTSYLLENVRTFLTADPRGLPDWRRVCDAIRGSLGAVGCTVAVCSAEVLQALNRRFRVPAMLPRHGDMTVMRTDPIWFVPAACGDEGVLRYLQTALNKSDPGPVMVMALCLPDHGCFLVVEFPTAEASPKPTCLETLCALQDLLMGAVENTSRYQNVEFDSLGATIAELGFGLLVLDSRGRVRHLSGNAVDLVGGASREQASEWYASALAEHVALPGPLSGRVVLRPETRMLSAVFAPIPERLRFMATPLQHMVTVSHLADLTPVIDRVAAQYHLTKAEQRILAGLAEGLVLNDVAQRNGITEGTARQQLKAVFRKTEKSAQHQLIAMLLNLTT